MRRRVPGDGGEGAGGAADRDGERGTARDRTDRRRRACGVRTEGRTRLPAGPGRQGREDAQLARGPKSGELFRELEAEDWAAALVRVALRGERVPCASAVHGAPRTVVRGFDPGRQSQDIAPALEDGHLVDGSTHDRGKLAPPAGAAEARQVPVGEVAQDGGERQPQQMERGGTRRPSSATSSAPWSRAIASLWADRCRKSVVHPPSTNWPQSGGPSRRRRRIPCRQWDCAFESRSVVAESAGTSPVCTAPEALSYASSSSLRMVARRLGSSERCQAPNRARRNLISVCGALSWRKSLRYSDSKAMRRSM